MTDNRRKKQELFLISAALVIATVAAYEPMRHNGFVEFDDATYITKNLNINKGITLQSITWALTKPYAANWHPLTWLSHMLDYQLFGLKPLGHHFVSLVFHISNALLLLWILYIMTGAIWPSAFVAAVFALHPLQVESVAWAAERKNLLGGFFWLLTTASYIWYVRRPGAGRYILLILVYGLSIMAKPMVVTLPLVLLLLDYWPLERLKTRRSILNSIVEKIPLLVLSGISSVMTLIAQKSEGSVIALARIPLNYRIANVFTSYIRYIGKMIWPSRLPIYYSDPNINLLDAKEVISAVLLVLITAISIYTFRRRKYAAMGWLWYVGTLVPMIGLVQVGLQAMANRYMYISMLGLLIIVAWLVNDAVVKWPRLRVAIVILAVAALTSSVILTRNQVRHWQNGITLFEYALKVTENNALAEQNYGCALAEADRLDEAEVHFKNAIRILPSFTDALDNLGKIFLQQRKPSEAIDCFNEVLKQNKDSAATHFKLAVALGMQNKYDEAIRHLTRAENIDPNFPEVRSTMGIALMAVGRTDEAISCFNEVIKQNEDSATAHYNLAIALGTQNRYDEAIKHLDRVLKLEPNYPDARNKMALALLTTGRLNEAIASFNEILKQNEEAAGAHYNLAVALGMQKKYDEAIKQLARVLELDPSYPDAHNKMGTLLASTSRLEEAIKHFNEALRTETDKTKQYANLARAYQQLGKYDEAIQNWTKAAESKPDDVGFANNLAWLLATVGNVTIEDAKKAVELAERACEQTGYKETVLLDTLAASYAAAGRFEEAATTAQKAIDATKVRGHEEMASKIEKRLELYRAGKRYIQK